MSSISGSYAAAATDEHQQPQTEGKRHKIFGLYGVSGSGKTTLLNKLRQKLNNDEFLFKDGSDMLEITVPGGLIEFKKMEDSDKTKYRKQAIKAIEKECADSGRHGVVAGHAMFWDAQGGSLGTPQPIWTEADLEVYDHIIHLNTPPQDIRDRSIKDTGRQRAILTVQAYDEWQKSEQELLRKLCYGKRILFSILQVPDALERSLKLIQDTCIHSEQRNLSLAEQQLDQAVAPILPQLQTMLVLDGDKTLTAQDTGFLFWKVFDGLSAGEAHNGEPLKTLFKKMGYTYAAFRQAVVMYESCMNDKQYAYFCSKVANAVTMYPEFVSLLQAVAEHPSVSAVVVTSGLRQVWEKVLRKEGLFDIVKVIGGGRISDGYVVTAEVKAALVNRMQNHYKKKVWAFGDGPLDLDMLKIAHRAVVVVGEEKTRSKSMEGKLNAAVGAGLQAYQVLLPSTVKARLNTTQLPVLDLTSSSVFDELFGSTHSNYTTTMHHATEKRAAALLVTPTRDKDMEGSELRQAHRSVGWYLAIEYLSSDNIIGLEEYDITHVNNSLTTRHRLRHDSKTTIIALMRGGEPMAFGVADAMPTAMFLHANSPDDVKSHHITGLYSVVLVDSVVNSGGTILAFIEHIRKLHATIRIVVVAGVVQNEVIAGRKFNGHANVKLVALRISRNKYTGSGGTDTGNRLFNTTHLERTPTQQEVYEGHIA